jgi:hypothetical protein
MILSIHADTTGFTRSVDAMGIPASEKTKLPGTRKKKKGKRKKVPEGKKASTPLERKLKRAALRTEHDNYSELE